MGVGCWADEVGNRGTFVWFVVGGGGVCWAAGDGD